MGDSTDATEWGRRKGRVILKKPVIVHIDDDNGGKFFREEVKYKCYCNIKGCAPGTLMPDSTWRDHHRGARRNAAKTGKEILLPTRALCARYRYRDLNEDDNLRLLRFVGGQGAEAEFREVPVDRNNQDQDACARSYPDDADGHEAYEGCYPDHTYDDEILRTEDELMIARDNDNNGSWDVRDTEAANEAGEMSVNYSIEIDSMNQKPELVSILQEEGNSNLREMFVSLIRLWKKENRAMCHIDEELDILHKALGIIPDSGQWRGIHKTLNPGYGKIYACQHHHSTAEDKNEKCQSELENSGQKCGEPMTKCIRYNSVLDAIYMKMHQKKFREGIKHGPNVDYETERQKKICTSIWSADFVCRMRERYPDFFDTQQHTPLLFGIFVDGFRTSGASNTAGSITLVCLNLPGDIRMDIDQLNLIQLMDGPNEPGILGYQRYLRIIVNEFKALWGGFQIDGEKYRAALICTIQDGRAVSKTAMMDEAGAKYGCLKCTTKRKPLSSNGKHYYSSKGNLEIGDERRNSPCQGGEKCLDEWRRKDHTFILTRAEEVDSLCPDMLAGVKGKSVFFDLPYWDAGECHLVCFMHTIKNFGVKLQKLTQGELEGPDTRREILEKKFITDESFAPVEKIDKNGKKKFTVPSKAPPWVFKQNAEDNRHGKSGSLILSTMFPSSNLCVQPTRLFRKMQRISGNFKRKEEGRQEDIGDKDTGESAPMKQFLLTGIFSCVLYYSGVDKDLVCALDKLIVLINKLTSPTIEMSSIDDVEVGIWKALCELENTIPMTELPLCIHNIGHLAHQVRMFGPLAETWAYPLESYLGSLKGMAKNLTHPTATIYNRHMYNTVVSYLIAILGDEEETCHAKYVDDITMKGSSTSCQLHSKDLDEIKEYIEKNWKSYGKLKRDLKDDNPWNAGQRMTQIEKGEYKGRKLKILNGIDRKAQQYRRFTINRSTFCIKKKKKRDDRVIFFDGNRVGILSRVVEVQVSLPLKYPCLDTFCDYNLVHAVPRQNRSLFKGRNIEECTEARSVRLFKNWNHVQ